MPWVHFFISALSIFPPLKNGVSPVPLDKRWLSVIENNLQPARAATDKLSCVALAPAFHKADLYSEASPGLLCELVVVRPLQAVGLLILKGLDGETREHFVHQQRPRVRVVQCGRLDEDGVAAAVVYPHAISLLGELDPVADLATHFLHQLALVVRVELSEAEAVPLR